MNRNSKRRRSTAAAVAEVAEEVYSSTVLTIMKPVAITMLLVIWVCRVIDIPTLRQFQSVYMVYDENAAEAAKDTTPIILLGAVFNAIGKITQLPGKLLDYSVHSVTRGKEALGEVFVKVDFGGKVTVGKGASTDIIEASAKAYLDALNKHLAGAR
jgi:2-isopropylmalate synthase